MFNPECKDARRLFWAYLYGTLVAFSAPFIEPPIDFSKSFTSTYTRAKYCRIIATDP